MYTETTRTKLIKLIGTAYTTIRIEDASILLGVNLQQMEEIARSKNWVLDNGFILPEEESKPETLPVSPEKQIAALSSFVSCLEN